MKVSRELMSEILVEEHNCTPEIADMIVSCRPPSKPAWEHSGSDSQCFINPSVMISALNSLANSFTVLDDSISSIERFECSELLSIEDAAKLLGCKPTRSIKSRLRSALLQYGIAEIKLADLAGKYRKKDLGSLINRLKPGEHQPPQSIQKTRSYIKRKER